MSRAIGKLGDLVDIRGGGTPSKAIPEYWGGAIPWASVKDFKGGVLKVTEDYITELAVSCSATNVIPAGNIIVPTRMALGKVAINEVDMAINQDLKALQVRDESTLSTQYLFHFLKSKAKFLEEQGKGATVKGITLDVLKGLEIPIHTLADQKRIATILDKMDAIRSKRLQSIQLAGDVLRAVFLEMLGDPATNPKSWPVYKMSEVIDFRGGSQPPKETFEYEERPGYVRLVQIRDFRTDKYKTYIPAHLARRRFEMDDVMIGRYGPPVFQILRGLSGSYNVALMKAVPKAGVTKDFVYRLLQLPTYQDAVIANSERTAGQSGVNLDLLNSLDVPLPPVVVQDEMSSKIKKAEVLLNKLKLDLAVVERLSSSFSQSAFPGGDKWQGVEA
ncbi:type I restriction enzyme, S subunit [Pseudomonas syringae]|uniref:restriction endonuclease subunit S n=1 Tax=Pseudomonas syringae TaxID=317 RepID=UPI0008E7A4CE|nr:restriction endonuclease subunit S [Pseudomonas syringae]SFG74439.1 type I restriction enzyme, S subunit [Pseudomonas syringae]